MSSIDKINVGGVDFDITSSPTPVMAPVETGTTATQAYAVGDYVIVGSTLHEVTAAIAIDDTFTEGINISTSTSLGDEIKQLNNDLTDKVSGFTDATYSAVTGLAYDNTNKKLGLKVNGADTVIPFSGKEIIYLGSGTSFDLKSYSGYNNFTTSSFICEINNETGYVSANANYDSAYATSSISLNKTYDPVTGILNTSVILQTQVHQGSGYHFYQTQNKVVSVKAYLILN